ncbi:hypothetical protein Poli38472_008307 [Pythium oligandrum]|uniref:PDZ domain-containing protein n=1 Tax=Pythium oligandrum TaxID=41045 RepID=A0A8K1CLW1_PYTOL|nr:hypothetical protein Poli38472_008307 [Pythium oligandrum]|eukprot:TMW65665.1 hypothetical protein Poli38472_008307 [Pythium oligandrum]
MEYEVVWGGEPLGLTLRPDRGKNMPPVVGRITRAGSTAAHAKVAVGDMLVGINGVDTTGQGDGTPPLVAFDALRRNLLRLVGVSESEPAMLDTRPEYSTHTIEIDSIPTEPVPEATTTAFHDVQPKLESLVGAQETYRLVRESIAEYAFEYRCFSDWTITAGVLVVGEELEITIAVLRVASSNTSVVDFRLLQGDDMHFLRLVKLSRRSFFPQWPFDCGVGPRTTTEDALREMIIDIMSADMHPVLRESAAQEFKDACVDQTNRNTLQTRMPADLLHVLRIMLADNNGRVVLFGLFILLEYAKQPSVRWDGLEDKDLSDQCDLLLKSPCRQSVKWLVRRLQEVKLGGSISVKEDYEHRESQSHLRDLDLGAESSISAGISGIPFTFEGEAATIVSKAEGDVVPPTGGESESEDECEIGRLSAKQLFIKHLYFVLSEKQVPSCLQWHPTDQYKFLWYLSGEAELVAYLQQRRGRFNVKKIASFRAKLEEFNLFGSEAYHNGKKCLIFTSVDQLFYQKMYCEGNSTRDRAIDGFHGHEEAMISDFESKIDTRGQPEPTRSTSEYAQAQCNMDWASVPFMENLSGMRLSDEFETIHWNEVSMLNEPLPFEGQSASIASKDTKTKIRMAMTKKKRVWGDSPAGRRV